MTPAPQNRQSAAEHARRSTLIGIAVNGGLALIKGTAGLLGNSFALVADAIESLTDVISSIVVWTGLRVAASPPSQRHPFGKGRAETLAALVVSLTLLVAAVAIARQSVFEIRTPHHAPAPFTLVVLVVVIVTKELLFRFVFRVAQEVSSTAVKTDAWHHRSDAITSAAAFVGISIALIGGKGYESADDWAALVASAIIAINAWNLLVPALRELTDASPDTAIESQIRTIATTVPGVHGTHRCWVRKLGFDHYVDLDVLVDPDITVRDGHDIAHNVQQAIRDAVPYVTRVMVHIEPVDEYGRHKLEWEK
jgi:cation diffusion facilitator family transporter